MIWLLPWEKDVETRHTPWATWLIVFVNVVVFLMMLLSSDAGESAFASYGLNAKHPQWYQFITSDFLHGGFLHLFFNMVFLLLFGDKVEDAFGPLGFLLLYLLGGLAGSLIFVHANAWSDLPSVGASGCISAVAGAYGALFLSSSIGVRVFLLVFPLGTVQLPAVLFLLLYFGSDVYATYAGHGALDPQDSTNFVAHGIGFVFGLVVGIVGLLHGLRRRYETLEDGDDWFGYWPARLEATSRRKRHPRRKQ